MKKLPFILSVIAMLCLLCACEGKKCKHEIVIDPAVEATCIDSGLTQGEHCALCHEVLVAQEVVEALGHLEDNRGQILLSCTQWGKSGTTTCARCGLLLQEDAYRAPTEHHYESGICTYCGHGQVDYRDISQYHSKEGPAFFADATNGEGMQALYDEMEQVLSAFHHDATQDAPYYEYNSELGDLYTVAQFNFRQYNISLEEAKTVYVLFRKDHPVFYWMSYWLYWSGNTITITTVTEFAKGADRATANELVYASIEEYARLAEGETSPYGIALIYYDAIMEKNQYAYTKQGFEESAQWAHSIYGGFRYGEFVCEGYAKLFQLLLNLSGVENMYISGNTPTSHLWNLLRLDDGNWYWFDLTWADQNYDPYSYFALTDTLLRTHTPTPSNQLGMYTNMSLPARATEDFSMDTVLEIGEQFTHDDGNTYELISAYTVKTVENISNAGEQIAYEGRVYQVTQKAS